MCEILTLQSLFVYNLLTVYNNQRQYYIRFQNIGRFKIFITKYFENCLHKIYDRRTILSSNDQHDAIFIFNLGQKIKNYRKVIQE